ncbi:MAG: glycosyltransferase, partial [Blastocatellia bacterium]
MNRLLICTPSRSVRGGVETIINDLCRDLPSRGWDPIVALGKGSRYNDVDAYKNANPGIDALEIDGTSGTRQARFEALKKLIESVKPDVVLSARLFDVYRAVSALKRKHKSPRLAVTIRG